MRPHLRDSGSRIDADACCGDIKSAWAAVQEEAGLDGDVDSRTPIRLPALDHAFAPLLHRLTRAGSPCRYMVGDIKKARERARILAKDVAITKGIVSDLSDGTPHTLKHTAITWALQQRATRWDAAGYFSTSAQTIEPTYGHHSQNHLETVRRAMHSRQAVR